jgi:DNA primase
MEGGQTGTPDAKYINSPESPLFNKSSTLYAWHLARAEIGKRDSVIITEGYMDAIALHEAGFGNTIATLGTALTTLHVAALARLAPRNVYLCYDGDSAGINAALRSAPLFAAHDLRVRAVVLPRGEDPDTYIKTYGAAAFENALRSAQLLSRYRLELAVTDFDLTDVAQRMEAIRAGAEVIAEIDNLIEKDDYISWLTERWARAENISEPARLQIMSVAVRREVTLASNRRSRPTHAPAPRPREVDAVAETTGGSMAQTNRLLSGVARAEAMLLACLLRDPTWRPHIMELLPPSLYTEEAHREIASALKAYPNDAVPDAQELIATLSDEAGDIVGRLMVCTEGEIASTEPVIADCARRVEDYWAHQREREILELVQNRIDSGEPIEEEDRSAYSAALDAAFIATRRKVVPVSEENNESEEAV